MIHCSAGSTLGVGHLVRSLALAEEAVARGHQVTSRVTTTGAFVEGLLAALPVAVHRTPGDLSSWARELEADVVHVDSYAPIEPHPGRLLLSNIEDGSFGRRPADLAVDPNLGAEGTSARTCLRRSCCGAPATHPFGSAVASRRGQAADPGGSRAGCWSSWAAPTRYDLSAARRRRSGRHRAPPRDHRGGAGQPPPTTVDAPRPARRVCGCELLSGVADLPARMLAHDLRRQCRRHVGLGALLPRACPWRWCAPSTTRSRATTESWRRTRLWGSDIGFRTSRGPRRRCGSCCSTLPRGAPWPTERRPSSTAAAPGGSSAPGSSCSSGCPACHRSGGRDALCDGRGRRAAARLAQRPGHSGGVTDHGSGPVRRPRALARADTGRDDRLLLIGSDDDGDVGSLRWDRRSENEWEVSITVAPARRGTGIGRPFLQRANALCSRSSGGRCSAWLPSGRQRCVSTPVHEIGLSPRNSSRRGRVRAFRQAVGRPLESRRP